MNIEFAFIIRRCRPEIKPLLWNTTLCGVFSRSVRGRGRCGGPFRSTRNSEGCLMKKTGGFAAAAALLLCTAACSYRMRDAGRRAPASSTAESAPAATQTTENGRTAPAAAETEREMPPVTTAGSSSAATTSPKTAPRATRPTAPPAAKPTDNRQAPWEQALRALTGGYTRELPKAKQDKSEVGGHTRSSFHREGFPQYPARAGNRAAATGTGQQGRRCHGADRGTEEFQRHRHRESV